MEEMSLNSKLEVALEILSSKIADASKKGLTTEDKEMQELLNARSLMYSGDEQILDKIINVYGPEVRKNIEGK